MASRRNPSTAHTDDFSAARRAFEHWRSNRSGPTRIPEPLWASAVRLARKHGVNPTARALGLDYYSLKKRLEAPDAARPKRRRAQRRSERKPAFVQLPLTDVTKRGGYAVMLEKKSDGVKLRFEFDSAPELGSLEAMARALLSAAQ